MLCLSLCHSVFTKDIHNSNNKRILYQASSPDELSLVSAARYFGFKFTRREIGNKIILSINNKSSEYIVTHILEFTCERKRMSVVVKCPEGKIYLFCKGADSMIRQLITGNSSLLGRTEEIVTEFANSGLRTLMIAYKELTIKEYEDFDKNYQTERNKDNKDLNHVYDSIENSLILLGSTGIEDQLQDEVAETIYSFIDIGIKVWVLTGDKIGTAMSIAHSCNLLKKDSEILEIKEPINEKELDNSLNNYIDIVTKKREKKNYGLVICSNELAFIISNKRLSHLVN
jgi:magnesium-transporting ATPase (P-type)